MYIWQAVRTLSGRIVARRKPDCSIRLGYASQESWIVYLIDQSSLRRICGPDGSLDFELRTQLGRGVVECALLAMVSAAALSPREAWGLLALVGACVGFMMNSSFEGDDAPLLASLAFSGVAFAVAFSLIRWLGPVFMKAGLKGKDMAKPKRPEMYETNLL